MIKNILKNLGELDVDRIESEFNRKIYLCRQGEMAFQELFDISKLSVRDSFLLVLTDNSECIRYGIKYLPDYIENYNIENVYVLLENCEFEEKFVKAGGKVKVCKREILSSIAVYLSLFEIDGRVIFLTEKDSYGSSIEPLMERGEFSLEEYIVIGLYRLKKLREDIESVWI